MNVCNLKYPFRRIDTKAQVLAMGYFDGVHRGHQQVLLRAKELSDECDAIAGVLTFHPHPTEVLNRNPICRYVTPLEEKIVQFHKYGIDTIYVMRFDIPFSQVSKEEFVEALFGKLALKGTVIGSNFTFGRGACGNPNDLHQLSQGRFKVEVVDLLQEEGRAISSTRVREALAKGQIEEVTTILGRRYRIRGEVVSGDQRGRTLGFPTANISLAQPFLVPRYGVYVVDVKMKDGQYVKGIMNIGVRPTIHQLYPSERIEVHLFDWNKVIYGEDVTIYFLHYLRDEKKFSSISTLIEQIHRDLNDAKSWLAQVATV